MFYSETNYGTMLFSRCGSSNVGQSVVEILAEYSKIQEFRKVMGNVITLLELCLRNAPGKNIYNIINFHLKIISI
jgi:hypothetical protein